MLRRAILAFACLLAPAALADDREQSSWKVTNPFSPCGGDCSIALLAGKSISLTPATSIFLLKEPPEKWQWDNSYIVTLSTSRTLVQYGEYFSIDPEIGVGRYHGNAYGGEVWLALYLRWRYFPWNDYVRTSVGVGIGPSVASNIGIWSPDGIWTTSGVAVANFFSPELELALPSTPGIGLVVRFHHRSYMWGVYQQTGADAQFWTAGLRVHF